MTFSAPFLGAFRPRLASAPVELPLFAFALALRLLFLGSDPLWLDEIITFEVGRGGPAAFFRFSTMTPHPPLYYLLQWASAGFGLSNAGVAWRWLPALCGALTIPLIYRLAALVAGERSALAAALLAAVSPTHIYFSQEARPYALLTLLAAAGALALERARRLQTRRALLPVVAIWVVGVCCGYSFGAVVAVQLLWLCFHWPISRRILTIVAGVACFGALLAWLAYQPMLWIARSAAASGATLAPADVLNTLLLLDSARYGLFWGHTLVPGLLLALISVGAAHAAIVRRLPPATLCALQLLLPVAGVFLVLIGALGVTMPVKDAKQFIVLLPAAYALLAAGLDRLLTGRLGRAGVAIAAVSLLVVLLAYGEGLGRYWTTTKSPEGRLVRAVMARQAPGDALIVAHYSLGAAASFYQPDAARFFNGKRRGGEHWFAYARPLGLTAPPPEPTHSLSAIVAAHSRLWLLTSRFPQEDARPLLDARCARQEELAEHPFEALLYVCPGP